MMLNTVTKTNLINRKGAILWGHSGGPLCNETENRTNVGVSDVVGNPQKKQMLSSDPEAAAKPRSGCLMPLELLLVVALRLEDIMSVTSPRQQIHLCWCSVPRGLFAKDTEQLAELRTHLHNRKSERKLSPYFNILRVYVKIQSLLSSGSYTGAYLCLSWMYL